MHDDVSPVRAGVAQQRARHGVVDNQRHTVGVRDIGHRRNVKHDQARVAERLGEDRARTRAHGAGKGLRIARIDEGGLDAELAQVDGQHGDRAAIQRACGHDVVARLQQRGQRHGLCRHARGTADRGTGTLQRGDALLERRHSRVAQARVDIAEGLQVEQAGGMLRTVEDEAGRPVDRQRTSPGGRVGDLPGVDGQGLGSEDMVAHGTFTPAAARK